MAKRLSYSMLLLAWSVAPAVAGTSGSADDVGWSIIHLAEKIWPLLNMF